MLFLVSGIPLSIRGQNSQLNFDELVNQRRWVELRSAVAKSNQADFYRGVAAAVFNQPDAESLFKAVIRAEPSSEHSYEAYNWLANLYQKSGRYHSLAVIRQAQWKAFPNNKVITSQQKEDTPFMALPDQKNGARRSFTFHHDGDSLPAPATINGKHVEFFFDNGADLSCISENEAKRLGMTLSDASGSMGTMTQSVAFHMATAKNVTIGKMHFNNVSFAVFPDNQPPMSFVPMGQRGIFGLPLVVAIGTFDWNANGTLTIGGRPQRLVPEKSNLIFDYGDHVVLRASFQDQPIWTAFDSGASTTDIYAPFARRFSEYLQHDGKAGKNEIIGIGGSENYDSIDLPALLLEISGKRLTLRPAHVMTKRQDHRDWIFANVGKDLYMQTSGFTLDFQAMRLNLE